MSKKQLILIAAGVMAVSLLNGCSTAAGGNQTADTTQAVQTAEDTETEKETDNSAAEERSFEETAMGKTRVVYYSATGNTERVANVIAETAGAEGRRAGFGHGRGLGLCIHSVYRLSYLVGHRRMAGG